MNVAVGRRAPDFELESTQGNEATRRDVSLAAYQDRWLALIFYPKDFSLVCPTELTALSARIDEFRQRGCELLGVSLDSIASHERWLATPRTRSGVAGLQFPLASDPDGAAARAYGVYLERQRVALRGLFLIDPNGVLQYATVHNLSVGRRSDEVVRILSALQSGGMCPEDWCAGCANLDPTEALNVGSVIGHFRIEQSVGHGSFAVVYKARDTVLDRIVALKILRPNRRVDANAFLREARAAAALNHPNVCTVFSADDGEGVPIIAMEFVEGQALSAFLNGSPIPMERVARIGHEIANGMSAAHSSGVVHGDLKPANVLLSDNGLVKITDFGLSRRILPTPSGEETVDWNPTSAGAISGTPSYMSPEQSRGEAITPASDVFALGLILYEMLTGKRLIDGENVLQTLDFIRNIDATPLAAEMQEPFATIIRDALVADPSSRAITMGRIAAMLG